MALKQPQSMDECIYFTRRTIEEGKGRIMAWAFRTDCPKCKKAKMGKPVEDGSVRIRAKEYTCPGCGFTEPKDEHEKRLSLSVVYTCPGCGKSGEASTEYMLKSFEGVKAFIFSCGSCGKKIGVTKKMKAPKKKGAVKEADDDDD